MNHEDLKQIKEKLRSIIYFHTSFNLGLLMMIMKLQELNILLYEDLKQIKEKLRSHFHASFNHETSRSRHNFIWGPKINQGKIGIVQF